MRIFELITPTEIQPQTKKPHDIEAGRRKSSYGDSAYGQGKPVSKHGIHGAEYSKTNYFPSELQDDAYYAYIQAVKPLMGGNPYVPEIYKIIKVRDPSGQIIPRYEMRSYESWDNFKQPELLSILAKIDPDEAQSAEDSNQTSGEVWGEIIYGIRRTAENGKTTNDPDLNELLEVIRNVVSSNPTFEYDMHGGNFLIRRTPYGAQLVITDPVQDGGHSTSKSSGKRPWGHKRGDLEISAAVNSLAYDLKDLVYDLMAGGNVAPTQDMANRLIRKISIQNKISVNGLVNRFIEMYKLTPLGYLQHELEKEKQEES